MKPPQRLAGRTRPLTAIVTMANMALVETLGRKYETLAPLLNERQRRSWAAVEAREAGWGGITAVALATGLSQTTIGLGLREMEQAADPTHLEPDSDRGRRPVTSHDPSLLTDLEALGFSLQSNRKTKEGVSHPDRNAQFEYISDRVRRFQR